MFKTFKKDIEFTEWNGASALSWIEMKIIIIPEIASIEYAWYNRRKLLKQT